MDFWFLLFVLLAEVVGTVAGFGSSTILLPVALFFFDFRLALVLVAIVHILGNLFKLGWFGKSIDWRVLLIFGMPSVMGSFIGAEMVKVIDVELLKKILGVFLIVYGGWNLLRKGVRIKLKVGSLVLGGSLSGFLAGLIGTGGALRGAFLSAYGLVKERYVVTMAVIALVVDLVRIPVYLNEGFLPEDYKGYLWLLILLTGIGVWLGQLIVRKVSVEMFKKIVLVGLLVIGIRFLLG